MQLTVKAALVLALFVAGCRSTAANNDGGTDAGLSSKAIANDAALSALVNGALACTWDPTGIVVRIAEDGGQCAGFQAWLYGTNVRRAARTATYFDMVESPDPRVRTLALQELPARTDWTTDPALSKRLIASAAKEPPDRMVFDSVIGVIDFPKTGLWPDVKALAEAPANAVFLKAIIHVVLGPPSNAKNLEIWTWVTSKLKDPALAPEVLTGLQAIRDPARRHDACTIYSDSLKDDRLAGNAMMYIAMPGGDCIGSFDTALGFAETWIKNGHLPLGLPLANELSWIAMNAKTPPATKTRALAALDSLAASTKVPPSDRAAGAQAAKDVRAKAP